jgi:hypothetical protein
MRLYLPFLGADASADWLFEYILRNTQVCTEQDDRVYISRGNGVYGTQ